MSIPSAEKDQCWMAFALKWFSFWRIGVFLFLLMDCSAR